MSQVPIINFSGGEVSKDVYGRMDSPVYRASAEHMENFIARVQGGMDFRGGSAYVHPSRQNQVGRIERFRFNDEQTYILEFTPLKVRIYEDTSITLDPTTSPITGATQADPVVVTDVGHPYANGDEIYISGVAGMTELNGRFFRVANQAANSYELLDLFDNNVDGTGFTAYSGPGTAQIIYELTTPYTADQIQEFQFAQSGNEMTFVHRSHPPQKLIRISAASWTFGTFARTNDPFTGANLYPGCFTYYEGRAVYASTNTAPDAVYGTRSPTSAGATRYTDHTTGSNADDAFVFVIASTQGEVEYINWLAGTRDFIGAGTESGVSGIDGGGTNAITPTNIRVRPLDPAGAQGIMPIANGSTLYYMQKGSRKLLSFEYELLDDAFKAFDRSFLTAHFTSGGVKKIAFQRGKSNVVWVVRNDGLLVGMTVKPKEDVSGWYRHTLGGDGIVIDIAIEPQTDGYDRVWVLGERTINGITTRYLEYFTEPFEGLSMEEFYTGVKATDDTDFANAMFELQRNLTYLDIHQVWDGADIAAGSITLTPGATTGTGITFTASAPVFAAGDVGKELWKKYSNRAGGGRATITGFTSTTQVVCTIDDDFDSTDAIAAGLWELTSDTITGLHHLEGESVEINVDGRVHPVKTVTAGTITLDLQSAKVVIGKKYNGIYKSMNLMFLLDSGAVLTDAKNLVDVDLLVSHSVGGKYGSSLYRLQQTTSSTAGSITDRPPLPTTGPLSHYFEDSWEDKKNVVILQDQAYPMTVNGIGLTLEVGET